MGDSLQAGKPSHYVTSHPGQLSLSNHPFVGRRNGYIPVGDSYGQPPLGNKTAVGPATRTVHTDPVG